ncbi:hypothetical protein BG418_19795 [Streptomyces sp. CBMA152]|nr:hypothetical protein [Streptomyces sp. CBMA152]
MIKPKIVHVMAFGPENKPGPVWFALGTEVIVELSRELAHDVTCQLGDQLGLFVSARDGVAEAAE